MMVKSRMIQIIKLFVTLCMVGILASGCSNKDSEKTESEVTEDSGENTDNDADNDTETATGSENESTVTTAEVLNADAKLTVWFCVNTEENEALQVIGDQFEKETGVEIEVLDSNFFSIRQKFPLAAETSERPDIVFFQSADLGALVETGYFKEIGFVDDEIRSRFETVGLEAMSYNGKLYGIGYSVDAYGVVYNKATVSEIPATWDEYFASAIANTVPDQHYGTLLAPTNYWFMYPIIKNYGGYYIGKDANGFFNTEDIGLDNEGTATAAKEFLELKKSGLLLPTSTENDNNISQKFAAGIVDMFIYGLYDAAKYTEAGIDYGYAPLPNNDDGTPSKPLCTVQGFGINAYSENQNEAEAFLNYIMKDENMQLLFEAGNGGDLKTGARNTCCIAVEESDYVQSSEVLKSLIAVGRTGEVFPTNPEAPVIWNSVAVALKSIYYDDADVEGKLAELAQKVKDDMQEVRNE